MSVDSNDKLRLGPRATCVRAFRVSAELDHLVPFDLQNLLEPGSNPIKNTLALFRAASLTASDIAVSAVRNALADSLRPDADTIEALANIDHNPHHLAVALIFEGLADSGEHDVQPKLVNRDATLFLERIRPFASMFVLGIFPFRPYAFLEKMVVGLDG